MMASAFSVPARRPRPRAIEPARGRGRRAGTENALAIIALGRAAELTLERMHEKPSKNPLAMTTLCPAGCYVENSGGQVEITPDGCLECGACRVLHPLELSAGRLWRAVQIRLTRRPAPANAT